jgi:hypothetical protein
MTVAKHDLFLKNDQRAIEDEFKNYNPGWHQRFKLRYTFY